MAFALGVIVGLLVAVLVVLTLLYMRVPVERVITIVEQKIGMAGPQPRGSIVLPDSEEDALRRDIIRRNDAAGRDTPLEELSSE